MERMGMPDDEPIEHPWVTKSIGDAQGKVEARNFDIRKNLLEYDDVMNEQRKTVYKIRQQLLLGIYKPEIIDEDGKATGKPREIKTLERLVEESKATVDEIVLAHAKALPSSNGGEGEANGSGRRPTKIEEVRELDLEALRSDLYQYYGYRFETKDAEAKAPQAVHARLMTEIPQSLTEQRERLLDLIDGICGAVAEECCPQNKPPEDWDWKGLRTGFVEHFGRKPTDYEEHHDLSDLVHAFYTQASATLEEKEKEMGTELLLRVFRHFYLEEMDRQWVEHLTTMEHLRDGIGLRGYGQRDPKQEYKKEGYNIFVNMMASTSSNVITKLFQVQVRRETDIQRMEREDAERHAREQQSMQMRHGSETPPADGDDAQPAPARRRPQVSAPPPRREAPKVSRNDLCPCGSGLKFKKCHGEMLDDGGDEDQPST
jgi:preprotein translocase subunit SecA